MPGDRVVAVVRRRGVAESGEVDGLAVDDPSSCSISADQFCEEPPSPWTYNAGGSPSRVGGLDRTVSVIPGSPTDLSRSPSATLTGATFGSTLVAGTDGSSVEDMRQCYETIT